MKARQILKTRGALVPVLAVVAALAAAFPPAVAAQSTGTLAGSVTADGGEVRAFRVKARDTVGRVAYTVYTVDGRYRIYNLPPGSYEVQLIEAGYAPLVKDGRGVGGPDGDGGPGAGVDGPGGGSGRRAPTVRAHGRTTAARR